MGWRRHDNQNEYWRIPLHDVGFLIKLKSIEDSVTIGIDIYVDSLITGVSTHSWTFSFEITYKVTDVVIIAYLPRSEGQKKLIFSTTTFPFVYLVPAALERSEFHVWILKFIGTKKNLWCHKSRWKHLRLGVWNAKWRNRQWLWQAGKHRRNRWRFNYRYWMHCAVQSIHRLRLKIWLTLGNKSWWRNEDSMSDTETARIFEDVMPRSTRRLILQ